jgi:hypothetical protein
VLPLALGAGALLALVLAAFAAFLLWPRSGRLLLEVEPADAEVIVSVEGEGRRVFELVGGRLELELPEGRHAASIRAVDHVPAELLLAVTAGELTRETVALELELGSAHFEVEPLEAELTLAPEGGEARQVDLAGGQTTLEIEPGVYTVTAARDGYETATETFTVEAGGEESIEIVLERKPVQRAKAPPETRTEVRTETKVVPVPVPVPVGRPYIPGRPYVPGVPRPPRMPRPPFP